MVIGDGISITTRRSTAVKSASFSTRAGWTALLPKNRILDPPSSTMIPLAFSESLVPIT